MSIVASVILLPVVSIAVALVALQIFLSRKPNKWLGIILPSIQFLLASVILILNLNVVTYMSESASVTVIANHAIPSINIMGLLGTFLLLNIPTMVDLIIYILCRRSMAKRKEVDKMRIQDL